MKKGWVILVLMLVVGCASMTTVDKSGFQNPVNDKYYDVQTVTVRDRFGTEVHGILVMDDAGKLVAQFQGYGPGLGNNMLQGAVAGLEQAGGLIGAGALIRPANYSGGNSASTSGASGGSATGGNATASQLQGQNQTQRQAQRQWQLQGQCQSQTVKNTSSGWIPPGQNK